MGKAAPGPASLEDALALWHDFVLYGTGFLDEQGRRVDPESVVVAPDGETATDGRCVYRSTSSGFRFIQGD